VKLLLKDEINLESSREGTERQLGLNPHENSIPPNETVESRIGSTAKGSFRKDLVGKADGVD